VNAEAFFSRMHPPVCGHVPEPGEFPLNSRDSLCYLNTVGPPGCHAGVAFRRRIAPAADLR